ncbi:MAG TPA: Ig-like domain-containing protein, partial [Candidatus Acidoferrales bacterium]
MRRTLLWCLAVVGALQGACGGGSVAGPPPPPPPPAITVSVSPSSASLLTGESQQFTATVTGSSNTAVTWAVNGVSGGNATVGAISTAGLYTAPSAAPSGAVTIRATSAASSSSSGSATASVVAPLVTAFAAAHFLDQATFGATSASIRQVQLVGFDQFLANEFAATSSTYPDPDSDPNTNSPNPYQQRF